ncbi:hypothetical protein LDE01_16510 [Lactobacillus delbrueckii subsp. delbrueckii]|nr:hypothetical protein LDE01_16510 [Lactobacillus delbrueckii subsp. delbrueckii]
MDHSYSNTKPHQKGKHLKLNDRTTIQELHSKGYSNRAIAAHQARSDMNSKEAQYPCIPAM